MSRPSTSYAVITREVQQIVADDSGNDPTVAAYMVARAAIVLVGSLRGATRAAELAYKLADEFASGDVAQ